VLRDEAVLLGDRCADVLVKGSATLQEPKGTFTLSLNRHRWRDGVVLSEGARQEGHDIRGRLRIPRKAKDEYREDAVTLTLAKGLAWLRET
jgi:hypothetical protein